MKKIVTISINNIIVAYYESYEKYIEYAEVVEEIKKQAYGKVTITIK
jgi:hypothetical protein